MLKKFRTLRADEIDCRIAQVKQNGLSLLLYKDARCDMNILDETVGPENWQRSHSRDNANCTVSIWDAEKKQWISKEDTGTESFTEKEKGLASDSFKRACFNWGIGRELYTAPFIWISSDDCNIKEKSDKKGYTCFDSFYVSNITYDSNRVINALQIKHTKTHRVVYEKGKIESEEPQENTKKSTFASVEDVKRIRDLISQKHEAKEEKILKVYSIKKLEDLPKNKVDEVIGILNKYQDAPVKSANKPIDPEEYGGLPFR